ASSAAPRILPETARTRAGVLPGAPIEPAAIVRLLLRLDHRRRVRYFRSGVRVLLKTGIGQMRTMFFVCRLALPVCALLFCSLHQAGAQGAAPGAAPVNVEQICTPD